MQIGTQKNCEWQNSEMVDYLYSVAIQANSFHYNNMVNKMVWQINRGRIKDFSLYNGMASFCTGLGTVHTQMNLNLVVTSIVYYCFPLLNRSCY